MLSPPLFLKANLHLPVYNLFLQLYLPKEGIHYLSLLHLFQALGKKADLIKPCVAHQKHLHTQWGHGEIGQPPQKEVPPPLMGNSHNPTPHALEYKFLLYKSDLEERNVCFKNEELIKKNCEGTRIIRRRSKSMLLNKIL